MMNHNMNLNNQKKLDSGIYKIKSSQNIRLDDEISRGGSNSQAASNPQA